MLACFVVVVRGKHKRYRGRFCRDPGDLIVIVVPVVLAIILMRRPTVVTSMRWAAMASSCHRVEMRGTSMLHLCGLNGHAIVDHRDVDGTLVRIAGGIALGMALVVAGSIPAAIVATIIPGAVRAAAMRGGLREGGIVSGLGVLHFGGVDGDAVVDHRHMVATVGNGSDGMAGTGSSVRSKVGRLGVLHLGSLNGSTVRMGNLSQRLGVCGIVLGLGSLHVGSVNGNAAVGEWHVGSRSTICPATAVDRTLVQMMSSGIVGGSSMCGSMGGLGVLHFRCVDGNATVGQHRNVDAVRLMGVGVWHIGGMAVGGSIDGSSMRDGRSLGQIGADGIEAMMRIRCVGHRLQVTMPIDIGVGAARGAIMGASLVLL